MCSAEISDFQFCDTVFSIFGVMYVAKGMVFDLEIVFYL